MISVLYIPSPLLRSPLDQGREISRTRECEVFHTLSVLVLYLLQRAQLWPRDVHVEREQRRETVASVNFLMVDLAPKPKNRHFLVSVEMHNGLDGRPDNLFIFALPGGGGIMVGAGVSRNPITLSEVNANNTINV